MLDVGTTLYDSGTTLSGERVFSFVSTVCVEQLSVAPLSSVGRGMGLP